MRTNLIREPMNMIATQGHRTRRHPLSIPTSEHPTLSLSEVRNSLALRHSPCLASMKATPNQRITRTDRQLVKSSATPRPIGPLYLPTGAPLGAANTREAILRKNEMSILGPIIPMRTMKQKSNLALSPAWTGRCLMTKLLNLLKVMIRRLWRMRSIKLSIG